MERYLKRLLPPAELILLDEHLLLCAECRGVLSKRLSEDGDFARSQLQSDELEHPGYDDLESYVDLSCDETDREIVESHLQLCSVCAADVREMQTFRKQAETDTPVSIKTTVVPFRGPQSSRLFRYAALAAAVVIIVLILNITRQPDRPKEAKSTSTPSHQKRETPQSTAPTETRLLAVLQDQGATIAIDANGKLSGADHFPPAYQQLAQVALTNQKVTIPPWVRDLAGDSHALLGDREPGAPFELIAPVGVVVESTRPHFQWEPLVGAQQYQVHVFDLEFHPVATSALISGNSWTPDRDLARSKVYVWSVIAMKDGQEIETPAPPEPEAHFQVLDSSTQQELQSLRTVGSHLLLGLACANAGLIPEARHELEILAQQNPDSPVARNLLESLSGKETK